MKPLQFILVVGLYCFVGCSRERQSSHSNIAKVSLEDAKTYYESLVFTRAEEQIEPCNTLYSGEVKPLWSTGIVSPGIFISEVGTMVDCKELFGVVVGIEGGKTVLIPLIPRLSIVCDKTDGKKSAYLKFYLPTIDCLNGRQNTVLSEASSGATKLFSGIVFCSTLSGFPVAIAEFVEGKVRKYAWLNDDRYTFEENWNRMRELGGCMLVSKIDTGVTRGVNDINPIEPVEVVGVMPIKPIVLTFRSLILPWDGPDLPDIDPIADRVGGGGSSSGGNSDVQINPNLLTKDSKVCKMIDTLTQDCLGRKLIESVDRAIEIKLIDGEACHYYRTTTGERVVSEYIEIGKNASIIGLVEELIHAYQNRNIYWTNNHRLNDEIEAKIGWALYLRRGDKDLDVYKKQLGNKKGVLAFEIFCDACEWDVISLADPSGLLFKELYYEIKDVFRMPESPYNDPVKYPFLDSYAHLSNLIELMADC